MIYNKIVQDCFFQPRHVGVLDTTQPLTVLFSSRQQNPSNTLIDLSMQCTKNGLVKKICFKVTGNPYVVAALEWLCRQIEGRQFTDLPVIDYLLLIKELEIPNKHYPIALQVENVYKEVLVLMKKKFEGGST